MTEDPHFTAYQREFEPGGHDPDATEDWSWMDRYSTGKAEPDFDFWIGFFVGVVACLATAAVAMAWVVW